MAHDTESSMREHLREDGPIEAAPRGVASGGPGQAAGRRRGPFQPRCAWVLGGVACIAIACVADAKPAAVDLGDPRASVHRQLGDPLRAWRPAHCPGHLIEMRQRAGVWLKLVFGPGDRLQSAGVFSLAASKPGPDGVRAAAALRWPGLAPGHDARGHYPDPARWRPLLESMGAKQWLWMEESTDPSDPADRLRLLGAIVVDDASDFAAGTGFPHDIAEAMLATGLPYHDTSVRENILPLLAWRRRTPPNATIESLSTAADAAPGCDATTLALPGYTDFRP